MSNHPAPRPTNNPSPTKTPSSEVPPSTSRTETHEDTVAAVEHNHPASSSPTFILHSTPEPGPSRIRPREDSSEQHLHKRFRAEPMSSKHSDRSSPSSDSQGGMADTEEGEQSRRSPETSEPQKKKRTRTLTTPHQSAVLHALLAQSRFPTTAMREEVGRAIGLSARKVQIWFQNQRQKARRPRTHNEMPMTRPPQYGPFPSGGDTEFLNLYPQGGAASSEPYSPAVHSSYPSPQRPTYTSPIPSGLLGPGVPGHSRSSQPQGTVSPVPATAGPSSSHHMRRDFLLRPPSPPRIYNLEQSRPATSHTSTSTRRYRDPSRTLPPLVFPLPSPQSSSAMIPPFRSAPANMPPHLPFQHARSPQFAFNPPSASIEPESSPTSLPPPFALEPQPQWNDPIYTSVPRTGSASMSRHRGSTSRIPATEPLRAPPEREQPFREGRYDPVRSTVIPYRPPSSPDASHYEEE
ncbi:hypothetical protein J3R30DRAFT_139591 [Lentinula aciculospora]|uniref:Homeobox domain-containing protein n=1 Tax=Lentinula aciculospora TaxID=153920 RepID=A0A9W9DYZ2_9AGAR|nr:hypothetical protein J3R30DRAFT_139591 [Lentinula aciculospora]